MNIRKNKTDLTKEMLYEGVKLLCEGTAPHIHLDQQKLFTLNSIAFQYMLYMSTKDPGIYLLRIEDTYLAEKLAKKSKDEVTRKFLEKLLLPRRLKYGNSIFLLDYFHPGTWGQLKEFALDKYRTALIIRNTTRRPFQESLNDNDEAQDLENPGTVESATGPSPYENFEYFHTLQDHFPKTITIAYGLQLPGPELVRFPFIREEDDRLISGVKISKDIKID